MFDEQILTSLDEQVLNIDDLYRVLRRAIVEMYLEPGAILSIRDICEHFKIGRSPARDTLLRLDQEGLVTLLPQRGTMISLIDLNRVNEERFMRLSVEEAVMKFFMACHTPTDITLLQKNLWEQYKLIEEDIDIRQFLALDDQFHQIFYAVSNKLFSHGTLQSISGHYRRMRLLSLDSKNLNEILKQHEGLITSFQTRDTEMMQSIFHLHICKLEREEIRIVKKLPHLFGEYESIAHKANLFWEGDYLKLIKINVQA